MLRHVAARSWAAAPAHRMASYAAPTLMLTALGVLAGCAAGSGVDGGADVRRHTPRSEFGASPTHNHPTKVPRTSATSPPAQHHTPPALTGGAQLSETLTFGGLEVRAIAYRKAGFAGGATGTRVDVVAVEECAPSSPARVQHRTWRLVDAAGRALGVAGGKLVNGFPTEDVPETLSAGQCIRTRLAIGVPAGSTPVAVKDGPDNLWILAD